MEQDAIYPSVILDSDYNSFGEKSQLKVNFYQPLKIDNNRRYVKIMLMMLPFTIENITAARGNNTLRYSVNGGGAYSTITLGDGTYEFSNVSETIKYQLAKNGHVQANDVYPFRVNVDSATQRGWLIIDTNWVTYTQVIVDLSNNNTSTFYTLYGFDATQKTLDGSVATEMISNGYADIFDAYFKIKMNHIRSFDTGGGADSSIIHHDFLRGVAGTFMILTSDQDIMAYLPPGNIQDFTIEILDRNNAPLKFVSKGLNSNVFMKLNIY